MPGAMCALQRHVCAMLLCAVDDALAGALWRLLACGSPQLTGILRPVQDCVASSAERLACAPRGRRCKSSRERLWDWIMAVWCIWIVLGRCGRACVDDEARAFLPRLGFQKHISEFARLADAASRRTTAIATKTIAPA